MKVGVVTTPNKKGQIVIPKKIRDKLNIDSTTPLNIVAKAQGVYIYPVKEVITDAESDTAYLDVLRETKGSFSKDAWKETREKRKKIETEASKRRKKQW